MVPFFHPLMVAVFGLGIAAAAHTRSRAARVGLALVGLLVAIALHGLLGSGLARRKRSALIYKICGAVMVPVFLTVLVMALVLRIRGGKMITAGTSIGSTSRFRRQRLQGRT